MATNGESGESTSALPDLTDVPLDEVMSSSDSALTQALRRVLRQTTGAEPPISAYSSGGQLLRLDEAEAGQQG